MICPVSDGGVGGAQARIHSRCPRAQQRCHSPPHPRQRVTLDAAARSRRGEIPLLFERGQGRRGAVHPLPQRGRSGTRARRAAGHRGGLSKQLARGDQALIGNSACRRYLRRTTPSANGKPGPVFEIDPGKLVAEARYEGLFVLRSNARITPLQAVSSRYDGNPASDVIEEPRHCTLVGGRIRFTRRVRPCSPVRSPTKC